MLWPRVPLCDLQRISEEDFLDARKSNGISLKSRCLSEIPRLPRTNLCSTVVSKICEAFGAKMCPSFSWVRPSRCQQDSKKKKKVQAGESLASSICLVPDSVDSSGHVLLCLQIWWRMLCTLTCRDIFSFCGPMSFLGDSCHPIPCDGGCWREPSDADTVVLDVSNLHLGWCVYFWATKTGFWVCWYRKPPLHCCLLAELYSALSFLGCAF